MTTPNIASTTSTKDTPRCIHCGKKLTSGKGIPAGNVGGLLGPECAARPEYSALNGIMEHIAGVFIPAGAATGSTLSKLKALGIQIQHEAVDGGFRITVVTLPAPTQPRKSKVKAGWARPIMDRFSTVQEGLTAEVNRVFPVDPQPLNEVSGARL
jgi:hypothetical protein